MTLRTYIEKRNGVPLGHPRSLRNNLYRSLGAKNFSTFWNYWNPVFGYYLGVGVYKPLRKYVPVGVALLLTFLVCGIVHDVVTTVVRGKVSLFFSFWFLLMGGAVLISRLLRQDLSGKTWIVRALVNFLIIAAAFCITWYIMKGAT